MFRFWPELKENRQKERDPRSLRGPSVLGSDDFDVDYQARCPEYQRNSASVVRDFILVHIILLPWR